MAVDFGTDVGQVAQALAAVFKAWDDFSAIVNSPAMLAARQSEAVQSALAKMDADLLAAQKTSDLTKIDAEASS
jgi:hypothetical protein